jgi:rRNA large subunit m3Psi methyltransferase RlmH
MFTALVNAKCVPNYLDSGFMKIIICAVGIINTQDSLALLIKEYLKPLGWDIELHERNFTQYNNIDTQKEREGKYLLDKSSKSNYKIALDSRGTMLKSEELALKIGGLLTSGKERIAFLIGGSYGLADEVLKSADFTLSFGLLTLPHKLARLVLIEQIYRAWSILNNRNYHK